MKIEKKELPKSLIEFKITVDEKELETYHTKGFSAVQKMVEIDGFRKGNAPEDVIVKKYGDMIILEEMANMALRDAYIKALEENKINPISEPTVSITKLAKGNPLELTITVPVLPKITLPNYKKVASEAINDNEKVEVTDKDIEDVLEELRKGRATENNHIHQHDHSDHNHDGHDHNHDHSHDTHDHKPDEPENSEAKHVETSAEIKKEIKLPSLDDTFAQSFGDNFKNLGDLKVKIGENLKLEKEQKLKEKRRTKIMEKLVEESKADLPDALIESELNNMLSQMRADITRFGGTWEDYLQHSKKTEAQLKSDWQKDAVKRAMSQLVLHTIAETEKLHATEEEIEVELVRLLAQVQDADEERARAYLHQALSNEKALKFLEENK